ncbi:MAG: RNA-binding protein [Lachnospiraceae bacterium]|nr:RNA-binding protein [Lachnospiraceae bacterium]
MDREEQLFCRRLQELADISDRRNIPTYSDFLSLNEQSLFWQMRQDFFFVDVTLEGLHPMAERKIACFQPKGAGADAPAPLSVVEMTPVNRKFSEELTHRDYLGTLIGLGIDRKKLGDIFISEQTAYAICMDSLASYICDNLTRVRHTNVSCKMVSPEAIQVEQNRKQVSGTVASFRIDALTALAFRLSRGKAADAVSAEKVFVNGRLVTSPGTVLKEGDIVSVRGMGRYVFVQAGGQTKKGRYGAELEVY